MHEQGGDRRVAAERDPPGEQLEDDDPQGIDVAPEVDGLPTGLLGAHVLGAAHHVAAGRRGRPFPHHLLGDPEVHHLGRAVRIDHHVERLQVAVHDPHAVYRLETVGDLRRQDASLRGRKRSSPLQHLLQVRALHQLHRDVLPRAVLAVLVDAAHVGMGDPPRELDLGAEALRHLGRGGDVPPQHLEGHGLVEHPVVGAVDGAHPASAERAQDLVTAPDDAPSGEDRQDRPAGEADLGGVVVGGSAGGTDHRSRQSSPGPRDMLSAWHPRP